MYDFAMKLFSFIASILAIPFVLAIFFVILIVVFVVAAILTIAIGIYAVPVAVYQTLFPKNS